MPIRILSEHLANQIAAGEVVQRPESAIKELVENSIDAGATHVTVVVKGAGKQLMHVIDNGSGMTRDDLELSIIRHATSKLLTEEDLHAIATLGFRGEALASIAAVADVEIRTRRSTEPTGWVLTARPGEPPSIKAEGCDVGTQVLVRNLFYNVPARRKFLKSDLSEFRAISDTMQRLALSRPHVRFTFYDGNVLVFDVHASDLKRRIAEILAIDVTQSLISAEAEEQGIRVSGFVGLPSIARQSRSGQFFFLNKRSITSRYLAHAVATAYEHLLESGRQPVFVLTISVDPHRVDVNVHPQKHEVKFDDERLVYLLVQQAVSRALQQANVVPAFLSDIGLAPSPLQSLPQQGGSALIVNRLTGEVLPSFQQQQGGWQGSNARTSEAYGSLFQSAEPSAPEQRTMQALQVDQRFVITYSNEGVVIVDQHAAHERVIYERMVHRSTDEAQAGQALLFSVRTQLSPSHAVLLREFLPEFIALGFRVDVHDDNSVDVMAVPSDVRPGNEERTLMDMLDAIEEVGVIPSNIRRERIIALFAARQAIRKGDRLQSNELTALIRDLFACTVPHVSPSGQPTYIIITYDELVQRFR
ncbi:MAG: DNA mismatch repair endonuclease MutL [Bacteroidetes bacterium]|nr:DNA mismatch repair endonuclease MutL [Bacteroidota bacterium]